MIDSFICISLYCPQTTCTPTAIGIFMMKNKSVINNSLRSKYSYVHIHVSALWQINCTLKKKILIHLFVRQWSQTVYRTFRGALENRKIKQNPSCISNYLQLFNFGKLWTVIWSCKRQSMHVHVKVYSRAFTIHVVSPLPPPP